jgi:hypothetical protein
LTGSNFPSTIHFLSSNLCFIFLENWAFYDEISELIRARLILRELLIRLI